jgi:predicted MFS family arabinose efflux permease
LTVAGLVGLAGQIPGGALVDAVRSERLVAGIAIAAIAVAALTYAAFPIFPVVLAAAVLHAAASCVLGPAIAAISLGLVGHAAVGERLGRNARFQSIGSGLAAGAMGACGYFFSARAVFIITALLLVPTLLALRRIAPGEINPERAHGGAPPPAEKRSPAEFLSLLRNRPLLIFAGCIMLFHLANAAMLPLMATVLTTQSSEWATLLIAMCIIVPQCVVAIISPWVGRKSQSWGRKRLLLIGLAAMSLRGLLFGTVTNPQLVVAVQLLDGLTAAVIGVMVPLIIADVTRGTGHFNLGQGLVGTMTGLGAAASATLAGYMTQYLNSQIAFLGLAGIGVTAVLVAWALMPETRPESGQDTSAAAGPDRPPTEHQP